MSSEDLPYGNMDEIVAASGFFFKNWIGNDLESLRGYLT